MHLRLNLTLNAPGLRDIWETIEPRFAALAGNKKSATMLWRTVLLLSNICLLLLPARSGQSPILRANRSGSVSYTHLGYAPEALSYVTKVPVVSPKIVDALLAKAFEANKITVDAIRPVNK